jgi:hypothetical protein
MLRCSNEIVFAGFGVGHMRDTKTKGFLDVIDSFGPAFI